MFKAGIILILLFSLFGTVFGRPKREERSSRQKEHETTAPIEVFTNRPNPMHIKCSKAPKDVRLRDLSALYSGSGETGSSIFTSNQTGFIEIIGSHSTESFTLCFPEDYKAQRQIYTFSHIVCRQMGFMTFASVNGRSLLSSTKSRRYPSLMPRSFSCTGQEQNISHCRWNNFTISNCQRVTEVSCGDCHSAINDVSGMIRSPGFPTSYLFDTTCEYEVAVPNQHSIFLSFAHLDSLFTEFSTVYCPLNKPYIEIIYGLMEKLTLRRYCSQEELTNLTIPYNEVKIRIFTGLYSLDLVRNLQLEENGLAITFEAILENKSARWPWRAIYLLLFLTTFITTTLICHYCYKYYFCNVLLFKKKRNELPIVNAPTLDELDRAYEFQRCKIQGKENKGLRLRSNGSNPKVSKIFFPDSSETNYEASKTITEKQISQMETPKTVIPEIMINGEFREGEIYDPISRVKANLLDRYSRTSRGTSNGSVSDVVSTSTPVFYRSVPFEIYKSKSSELTEAVKIKVPPYETAL